MNDATPNIIVFLGVIGLLAWWIAARNQPVANAAPHPEMGDFWTTPLYLRYNTPIFDGTSAIVPSVPGDNWSLASIYGE